MSGLLYFAPERPGVSRDDVVALNLGHLLEREGPGPAVTATMRGPDDRPGVIFSVAGKNGRASLQPTTAVSWSRIEGGELWLGVPEKRPGPDVLARLERMSGHEVELGDGRRWLVPVARLLHGGTRFPRKLRREGGRWVETVVQEPFAQLFDTALKVWDMLTAKGSADLSVDEAAAVAVSALGVNYRIGHAEASALELLDTSSMVRVLKALVDWPAVEDLGKAGAAAPL